MTAPMRNTTEFMMMVTLLPYESIRKPATETDNANNNTCYFHIHAISHTVR